MHVGNLATFRTEPKCTERCTVQNRWVILPCQTPQNNDTHLEARQRHGGLTLPVSRVLVALRAALLLLRQGCRQTQAWTFRTTVPRSMHVRETENGVANVVCHGLCVYALRERSPQPNRGEMQTVSSCCYGRDQLSRTPAQRLVVSTFEREHIYAYGQRK